MDAFFNSEYRLPSMVHRPSMISPAPPITFLTSSPPALSITPPCPRMGLDAVLCCKALQWLCLMPGLFSPDNLMANSLSYFMSLLRYHFLTRPDCPLENSNLYSWPTFLISPTLLFLIVSITCITFWYKI